METDFSRRTFLKGSAAAAGAYLIGLESVLAAAGGAQRPNGLFVFTLEHGVGGEADVDYRLELHGRYSHAPAHVEQLLTVSGLQPEISHAELRMEAGASVAGLVIRARKSVDP